MDSVRIVHVSIITTAHITEMDREIIRTDREMDSVRTAHVSIIMTAHITETDREMISVSSIMTGEIPRVVETIPEMRFLQQM
jgi:hypothetical protein